MNTEKLKVSEDNAETIRRAEKIYSIANKLNFKSHLSISADGNVWVMVDTGDKNPLEISVTSEERFDITLGIVEGFLKERTRKTKYEQRKEL